MPVASTLSRTFSPSLSSQSNSSPSHCRAARRATANHGVPHYSPSITAITTSILAATTNNREGATVRRVHSNPPLCCPGPSASLFSNSETPLASDTSESQLQIPASDFAFYEWDFRDDSESQPPTVAALSAAVVDPQSSSSSVSIGSLGKLQNDNSSSRISIEELMRPSIYKSQLTRELGTVLATELHSEMFGGIGSDLGQASRTSPTCPSPPQPPCLQPSGGTQGSHLTQPSLSMRERPFGKIPEELAIRGRRLRHHSVDVLPSMATDDQQQSRLTRTHRRAHTADFHLDRAAAAAAAEELRGSAPQTEHQESDRSGGFLRLLSRLSSSGKKKK